MNCSTSESFARLARGRFSSAFNSVSRFPQIPECKFANNERMCKNDMLVEEGDQFRIPPAQMLDPNRRVGKDHRARMRCLGGAFKRGSLPRLRHAICHHLVIFSMPGTGTAKDKL